MMSLTVFGTVACQIDKLLSSPAWAVLIGLTPFYFVLPLLTLIFSHFRKTKNSPVQQAKCELNIGRFSLLQGQIQVNVMG
jgi:flagellar basal body-associated protein FliL